MLGVPVIRTHRLIMLGLLECMQGPKGYRPRESTFATKTPMPRQKDPTQRSRLLQSSGLSNAANRSGEAFDTIAYKIAEAEAKSFLASEAVKEAEKILGMQEEAESMLLLTQEIYERCK